MAGPRRRHRPGPRRPHPVGQVLRRLLDQGRQGLLLQPLRRAEAEARSSPRPTTTRSSTTTRSARRSPTTSSSTSAPTRRTGASTADVTDDGQYLIITPRQGTDHKNRILYKDLADARTTGSPSSCSTDFDAEYDFIDNDGPTFWFKTDNDAPRGRVIAIDTTHAGREQLERDHPAGGRTRSSGVDVVGDRLLRRLPEGRPQPRSSVFDLDGKPRARRRAARPRHGRRLRRQARRHRDVLRLHQLHHARDHLSLRRRRPGRAASSASRRSTSTPTTTRPARSSTPARTAPASRCSSRRKKGLKLDGNEPDLPLRLRRLQHLAHARLLSPPTSPGWRWAASTPSPTCAAAANTARPGTRPARSCKKQNVFDDFIAAAEWLIAQQVHLAAEARHRAAAATAACWSAPAMTQRPDLFGAALPAVGVMDMLRFHKFTIGWAWVDDYGSSDDPDEFKALYAYSPLHNLKPGTYYPADARSPPPTTTTAWSRRTASSSPPASRPPSRRQPGLIRIETKAGHGAGKPTTKLIEYRPTSWPSSSRSSA